MNLFKNENLKHFVWLAEERKNFDAHFSEDEESIIQAMNDHPEFDEIWPLGDGAAVPQEVGNDIVNPFVHTAVHASIEIQVNQLRPKFVAEALMALQNRGIERHEAIHQIGAVYADLFFKRFRQGDDFEDAEYAARVKNLLDGKEKSNDPEDYEEEDLEPEPI